MRTTARVRGSSTAQAAALGVGVFVLSLGAVLLRPAGSQVAPWWPAAGVGVAGAALMASSHGPRGLARAVLVVLVGSFGANLVGGRSLGLSVAFAAGNGLEAAVGGRLLAGRSGRRPALTAPGDVVRLLSAAAAGACCCALLASAGVVLLETGGFVRTALQLGTSHATAVVVIAPALLGGGAAAAGRRWVQVLQVVLVVPFVLLVFAPGQDLPLTFLPMPLLVWGALVLGVRALAIELIALGLLLSVATANGGGPFAAATVHDSILLVQLLLLVMALVALPLCLVVAQREQVLAVLEERRQFEVGVLEAVSSGVVACDATGRVVLRNGAQRRLTGANGLEDPELGVRLRVLQQDGAPVEPHRAPLLRALAGERMEEVPLRMGPVGEPLVDVLLTARQVRAADGQLLGAVAALTDVTSQLAAQRELREAAAFHDAVLAASPDVVSVLAAHDGSVVWSSGAPLSASDLLVHPDDVRRLRASDMQLRGTADGEVLQVRYRLRAADGSWRWFSRRATPFARDRSGDVTEVLAVTRDVTDSVEGEERLRQVALHDPLTGLPNRLALAQVLSEALAVVPRQVHATEPSPPAAEVAVLFCDLDGFKQVNDTGGHAAGDEVLRVTARRLSDVLRPDDVVARVGGDEFVVVLQDSGGRGTGRPPTRQDAADVAERVRRALARPVTVDGNQHQVRVSIGLAFGAPGTDPDRLLRRADDAMYLAKASSRVTGRQDVVAR